MRALFLMPACAAALLGTSAWATPGHLHTNPMLGQAEGQCRPNETGPAFLISVLGLKDRRGDLKLELYPDNDRDFLEDDNILLNAGKTFRRVVVPVPRSGSPQICIRAPAPGNYALSLLHDRDRNHKFSLSVDGVGFGGNPRLGWSKPRAEDSSLHTGGGVSRGDIVLNYRRGLLSIGPLEKPHAHR